MYSTALSGGEGVVLLLLALVPAIIGLLLTYLVIRLAVRHALRDAARAGHLPLGLDAPMRVGGEPVAREPRAR